MKRSLNYKKNVDLFMVYALGRKEMKRRGVTCNSREPSAYFQEEDQKSLMRSILEWWDVLD